MKIYNSLLFFNVIKGNTFQKNHELKQQFLTKITRISQLHVNPLTSPVYIGKFKSQCIDKYGVLYKISAKTNRLNVIHRYARQTAWE